MAYAQGEDSNSKPTVSKLLNNTYIKHLPA